MTENRIVLSDNLEFLATVPDGAARLVYIDPPFNTGKRQQRQHACARCGDEDGDRVGFQRPSATRSELELGRSGYDGPPSATGTWPSWRPRLEEARRLLAPDDGSFFLHIDYREVPHYCKVAAGRGSSAARAS